MTCSLTWSIAFGIGYAPTCSVYEGIKNHMGSDVRALRNLILAFQALPESKYGRTFMDVSGYPHYENVCSNILAFYLDPAAEHGLNDLLLTALLKIAGRDGISATSHVKVERECGTSQNNRLDILLCSDSFTIGIENKIYHWLANDLNDYSQFIDSRAKHKNAVIKIVLGLKSIKDAQSMTKLQESGFVSLTYSQLWQEVRNELGHFISKAHPKWVTYLVDFMETTINLAGENVELNQIDDFFIEHNEEVAKMLLKHDAFLKRLTARIDELVPILGETREALKLAKPPYRFSSDRLVLDFEESTNGHPISFDLFLKPSGWDLQLFGRGPIAHSHLLKLLGTPKLQSMVAKASTSDNGRRYHLQQWDVRTELTEIRDAVCSWIIAISESAESLEKVMN